MTRFYATGFEFASLEDLNIDPPERCGTMLVMEFELVHFITGCSLKPNHEGQHMAECDIRAGKLIRVYWDIKIGSPVLPPDDDPADSFREG